MPSEKKYRRPATLDRVARQIEDLDWLLERAGFDRDKWKTKLQAGKEEGMLRLDLTLRRASGRSVLLSAVADPNASRANGIGERHFWIEGNHHYDRFAVGILRDELGEKTEREHALGRLCQLAEDAAQRVETGDVKELLEAIADVREHEGLNR